MKKVMMFLSFLLFSISSCKDCCEITDPVCNETVPTDEACRRPVIERWFFDSTTSTCEKIGYTGCEEYGFSTKEECETCKCND